MNVQCFALTPCDAWFFRDGRPYHHRESNQADVASVFPPSPRTLSGAVRAALARANGWDGKDRWPAALNSILGDGPNHLGNLQCMGPFLIESRSEGSHPLWPAPNHLVGEARAHGWNPTGFLVPDERPTETDLGQVRLPRLAQGPGQFTGSVKPAEGFWITAAGLQKTLAGQLPPAPDLRRPERLWSHESRVGLCRDPQSRIVGEGDLYSPSFVRLAPGVALGVGVAPLPQTPLPLPRILALGGESRLASAEPWPQSPIPQPPPLDAFVARPDGTIRFVILLLTPGRFPKKHQPALYLSDNVRTVSACVGKPQWIGGWDSLSRQPLPLEPFYPAGSIWFCETDAREFPQIHAQHGQWLGEYTQHGFGQIAIGLWPANPEH